MTLFEQEYRKYIRLGFFVCALFLICIVSAAMFIQIKGAVTATGTVVQIGENRSVEHSKGGSIKEILVKDGDTVKEGDPLVILGSVSITSQLALLTKQQFELNIRLDRLKALDADEETFSVDREKYGDLVDQYETEVNTQVSIFNAERNLTLTTLNELNSKLVGLKNEVRAIKRQRATNKQQLAILDESYEELKALFEKELISKSRVTQVERERINVLTQIESLDVSILQKENLYTETEKRIETFVKENKQSTVQEIEKTKEALSKIDADVLAVQDDFTRLTITAPVSGRIHELSVNTVNEVIKAGDSILQIVPNTSNYIIHSNVRLEDIDQVYLGQEARIRFNSFDQNKTPEIKGMVIFISADSIEENPREGIRTYIVKVSLEPSELKKITTGEIGSGLPVSTMFTTNERSLMNYVLKPIVDQFFTAFRED